MNEQVETSFKDIDKKVKDAYHIAEKARSKRLDPEPHVNVPLAKNMAERVEGIVGALRPQILHSGLSKRIQELEKKHGKSDVKVALIISLEVTKEKFCKFDNEIEAMETGIRVALAYLTLGVVASPLEGFVELKIKKTKQNKDYFCLMYSGPIRSAGGTAGALSVIVADYVRKNMGYEKYDPSEEEVRRSVTELYDYHERITNLQYLPSEKEILFLAKNLPVQVAGDPSEKIEVSNYKDLERIETNRIRSGHCLVMGECLAQKASKIWKIISQETKGFDMADWNFLEEFISLQKTAKSGEKKSETRILPVYTFIQDLVAGRPILTHPLAPGGFRLRYGRSRTTGYSATAIHPSTMHILNRYIATGTQLKVERPGKATAVTSCDSIDGPIVKLNDGTVLRLDDEITAKQVYKEIKEILFVGDILISYGDFYNRAHTLIPPGYCEEWWIIEVEKATVNKFGNLDLEKLSNLIELETEALQTLFDNPIKTKITAKEAYNISRKLKVPLHPRYTYHWNLLSTDDFFYLLKYLRSSNTKISKENPLKLIISYNEKVKEIFEWIGLPHIVANKEFIVVEKNDAYCILEIFNLESRRDEITEIKKDKEKETLFLINQISDVKLKDKSGTFIGARMGRPEKAKMRKLTGSPHTLFPVGDEGGRLRSFQSALEEGKITAEFPLFYCKKCENNTIFAVCENCDNNTEKRYNCSVCGIIKEEKCNHGPCPEHKEQAIDIKSLFNKYTKKFNIRTYPDLIKGVRGTSNKNHFPEHFVKGILRAKYDVCVNKDGTTRYDMTQLPITHFKPKEIGTSIKKLNELGYIHDMNGKKIVDTDQVLELLPQDIILPACNESPELGANNILFKTSLFVDDLYNYIHATDAIAIGTDE